MPVVPGCAPEGEITARALSPKLVLDRYSLIRRIGSGGFGAVWLARDETLRREVAVKVVPHQHDQEDSADGRPDREALAAARLNHPGIVALYEAGQDGEAHYLVSELVIGKTIDVLAEEGLLSDHDVAQIGIALCDALKHAHAQGVIHRDVKPQNVIVPEAPQSAAGVAKLTDFGIASLAGDDPLTRTGDIVGTLAYMAPEQAEGQRATAQSDLYALALVIYEALAGNNPARRATPAATAKRIGRPLPTLGRARGDLPSALIAAIDQSLNVEPKARGKLADLRSALAAAAGQLSDEPGIIGGSRLRRVALPTRVSSALLAAGIVGASAVAVGPPSPLVALIAALVTAALVALVPTIGWALAALATIGWLALGSDPRGGLCVVVLVATVACPLLAPRSPRAWWIAPLAPLLGLIGLAGAYPALAGQERTVWSRAALGALGFWWLALAQAVFGRGLYTLPAPGTLAPQRWDGSATGAITGAITPLITSGALIFSLVWALAAVVLPFFMRGRSWLPAVAGALAWAACLGVGTQLLGRAVEGVIPGSEPRGLIVGSGVGAVVALAAWAMRRGADCEEVA